MKHQFELVSLEMVDGAGNSVVHKKVTVALERKGNEKYVVLHGDGEWSFGLSEVESCCHMGRKGFIFNVADSCYVLKFEQLQDTQQFESQLKEIGEKCVSRFESRTEESSASQYFQFYSYLSQQQNMLQDYVRTSTYERAVLLNAVDFQDKVVLDVGAGSGILSFFSVQAGAKRVYAVEASSMAEHAETLVKFNNLSDKIKVIAGKIEEIELPEPVDILISEPMGYMLYNERMLETYLYAKRWLKKGGLMMPTLGDLHVAPFTDEALYIEQTTKANFWLQTHFHNVNLTVLHELAMQEYFRQPVVDTFDIRVCVSKSIKHSVNFLETDDSELHRIEIPLEFTLFHAATVHGLAFWFDVAFIGSQHTVWLSTSPTQPLTHWYQVRCLLNEPLLVKENQKLVGKVRLEANPRQSYDVTMELMIDGLPHTASTNCLDLKNSYFRYTGQPTQAPPGTNNISPTDAYWAQLDATQMGRIDGTGEISTMIDGSQWISGAGVTTEAGIEQIPTISNTLNNMVNGITLNGYTVGHVDIPGTTSLQPQHLQVTEDELKDADDVSTEEETEKKAPIERMSEAECESPTEEQTRTVGRKRRQLSAPSSTAQIFPSSPLSYQAPNA